MTDKFNHVRRAQQTRSHACHWPGCRIQVPPARWGCAPHWYALPQPIRIAIWSAYRSGQEESGRPSRDYLRAAKEAQDWIAKNKVSGDEL